ncbi:MAG: hypothetical protein AAB772_00130 [Patescibacteria group bacterium]
MLLPFIKKIQNSDQQTKKFWLIIMTGAAMTAVILVWLTILQIPAAEKDNAQKQPGPSHFAIFIKGLGIVGSEIYGKLLPFLIPGRSLNIEP